MIEPDDLPVPDEYAMQVARDANALLVNNRSADFGSRHLCLTRRQTA